MLTILVLAMIGVIFTMPQYFQGVQGTDAMGSGLRLLPLIGGLVLGAVPADRIASLLGAKITVALGFAILAVGMFLGATTAVNSSVGFVAAWMAVVGLGLGMTLATATSGALSELSTESAAVGSAVMQALTKMGGPLGTAILGSVLSATYIAKLDVTGLPPAIAAVVKEGLFSGLAVATKLGSPELCIRALRLRSRDERRADRRRGHRHRGFRSHADLPAERAEGGESGDSGAAPGQRAW